MYGEPVQDLTGWTSKRKLEFSLGVPQRDMVQVNSALGFIFVG